MAREAIVGYWNAEPDTLASPSRPRAIDQLAYLSSTRRFEVLWGELLSAFQVRRESDGAALFVTPIDLAALSDGVEIASIPTRICRLHRPSLDDFKSQMIWLRNYADLRGDRIGEIVDQTGALLPFFGAIGLLNASRRGATVELLSIVQTLCIVLEMRMKHFCWAPRPVDFATQVQPIIQTPDHSSFPSGHATEAFAIATVLYHLMTQTRLMDFPAVTSSVDPVPEPPMLVRAAHRIAVNRTVAGVHFPVDSAAGAMLGTAIGEAVIALATGSALAKTSYGATNPLGGGDFTQRWFMENRAPEAGENAHQMELLGRAYRRAQDEW